MVKSKVKKIQPVKAHSINLCFNLIGYKNVKCVKVADFMMNQIPNFFAQRLAISLA